ncbi:Na/Pi cotransporter family protein [Inediibacterium massiliense]|uniref:Na/Pi cotransporter family protein n=1 Tax=Inediibacterium massiliense TaxID=1658111 RepID=UPI0006B66A15|nr:Na/Pi symporter [Inediibacterium massiliense]
MLSILIGTILGIIIFFIGMMMITTSMQSLSHNHLKKIIASLTKNPLLGILVGILVTAVLQSSSTTSVLVVSLVNSRVMNLYQAASVMMGANIGTTFTGQLLSFNFFFWIPHILMVGVLLFYLNFSSFTKNIGKFFIGFSFLFMGIQMMVIFLKPLNNIMEFQNLILSIENQKMKGIFIGAITTTIIQSSSTGIAILQGLAANHSIGIFQAFPIILGQNIGTCSTTLFSSMITDKNGKRAAMIHLLFNIGGSILFYPFCHTFSHFIYSITPIDPIKQIANAHTLFNFISLCIFLPFINKMVDFSKKIIP